MEKKKKHNSHNLTEYGEIERFWNLDRLQKRETNIQLYNKFGFLPSQHLRQSGLYQTYSNTNK